MFFNVQGYSKGKIYFSKTTVASSVLQEEDLSHRAVCNAYKQCTSIENLVVLIVLRL